ncbi:MAG: Uma2 family endonuclease [Dehalococcoidia bacterium]
MVTTKAGQATSSPKRSGAATERPHRRFTVDEYLRMGETGIFGPEERTELVDGEILQMAAIGELHAVCLRKVTRWSYSNLPTDVIILVQDPVRVPPDFMPQPDAAIVRARPDEYRSGHPGPSDILLLIEVSDTTLGYDLGRKLGAYATAGVPEYWVFAIIRKQILVHRKPDAGRYTEVFEVGRGAAVSPLAFPDVSLTVDAILG